MYSFFLNGILLPVTPSKLQLKISNKNSTMTLIDMGEINLLKTPGLTDIDFEVLLPHTKYPFATYPNDKYMPIPYYLNMFEALKFDKNPIRFLVTRISATGKMLYDNNLLVSIEDYTIVDDVKEGFDVTVNIKLKQYRSFQTAYWTEEVNDRTEVTVQEERPVDADIENVMSHEVVEGDTLWAICKKYLGDGSRCYEIAELNNIVDADKIYPGQVIMFE
jgi:hypothetical protein